MKYVIQTETITINKNVDAGCNAIIFTNRGTTTVLINGQTLLANESMANNGLPGEIDVTRYDIVFSGAGTNALNIRRKIYVSQDFRN